MSQKTWEIYTGPSANGRTTMPNTKEAIRASMNNHAGTARPTYLEAGGTWYNTSSGKLYRYDGSNDIEVGPDPTLPAGATRPATLQAGNLWYNNVSNTIYFYDGARDLIIWQNGVRAIITTGATIDVSDKTVITLFHSVATTVTDFTNANAGQILTLWAANNNTTIDGSLTSTGVEIPLIGGDTMMFVYDVDGWMQISGTVGMGRFVPLNDDIGDWISDSASSRTLVDLSDDGVRPGAIAALLNFHIHTTGVTDLIVSRNSSGWSERLCTTPVGGFFRGIIEARLDAGATMYAYYAGNADSGSFAKVIGYWI